MFKDFARRSEQLERIDKGDYTAQEYEQFLVDIRKVNRLAGDNRALNRTLLREIKEEDLDEFSVLDVGAGSGELLRKCARAAKSANRDAELFGLELNTRSAAAILENSIAYKKIYSIQGDALNLPFADNSFDFAICSLFTHHFREREIQEILKEMSRVATKKIFVIDLHRHPLAFVLYKFFCAVFVKGSLVKEDGALSILRGFKPGELSRIAESAGLVTPSVDRHFPFRLVLEAAT